MKYLVENGVEPERIRLSEAAAFEPITTRIESAWQKENSRVEIFLLSELADDLPGMQAQGKALIDGEKPKAKPPAAKPAEPTGSAATHDEKGNAPADKGPSAQPKVSPDSESPHSESPTSSAEVKPDEKAAASDSK